jgi:electron transport complex protein RnfC
LSHTFKRGISIPTRKTASEGKPLEKAPQLKTVYIPINQHFGAPNKAIVAVGDVVKRGQKIAEGAAPGPMTVPVHASISGTVKKIEVRTLPNNAEGPCIVIEAAEGSGEEAFMPPLDWKTCSKEDALARIREAGIIGMGGAGFPAHVKLAPRTPVDLVIANGAECEPYLTCDEACLTEKTALVIEGLAIVMQITGVKKAIIGMEDNKAELLPVIEKAVKDGAYPGEISVGLCKTRYPQGGEKMLISALSGREVPSGGLPADVGCVVQNVGTLATIAEAFSKGKPCIDRDMTVTGGACKTPKNITVPIGTLMSDLCDMGFVSVDKDAVRKILFGGPMMGFAVPNMSIPVQKNNNGMVFMTEAETSAFAEGHCIRCSRCLQHCPMRLSPVLMNEALESGAYEEAVHYGLRDCIECGSCSYNCPARIKLVQRFRVGKILLREKLPPAKK